MNIILPTYEPQKLKHEEIERGGGEVGEVRHKERDWERAGQRRVNVLIKGRTKSFLSTGMTSR